VKYAIYRRGLLHLYRGPTYTVLVHWIPRYGSALLSLLMYEYPPVPPYADLYLYSTGYLGSQTKGAGLGLLAIRIRLLHTQARCDGGPFHTDLVDTTLP
jgi:hypothetical protein